jgi:hypothetical protein
VMLSMLLGSVLMVVGGMQRMAMRNLGMMRRFLVIAGFGVFGRLAMMRRRVVVVIRRNFVMLVDFVTVHCRLPVLPLR